MTPRWKAHADAIAAAHAGLDLRPEAIAALLARCEPHRLRAGEVLCRAGDPGDALYLLLSGTIAVTTGDHPDEPVARLDAPEVLGPLALLDHTRRTATCTATRDAELVRLDAPTFAALLRETSDEGSALRWLLLASLTRQLGRTNALLAGLGAGR